MTTQIISKAAAVMGGQSALARSLKVSQGLVWQWINGRTQVSAAQCIPIESATRGAVTRYDLRPDIFGPAPKRRKVA